MAIERDPLFWVNTVTLDHVQGAIAGGFTQADHGSAARLRRLRPGDGMVFYSPRTELHGGSPVQQFTAIATVSGEEPYQVIVSETFQPWRQDVRFRPSTAVDAKPLMTSLSFVKDPTHWGLPFRRGLFSIPEADFRVIERAMTH